MIRIVKAHSGQPVTVRQLQTWDRSGVVAAKLRGEKRKRLYTFDDVRRLCIIARLLKAKLPTQRLRQALQSIEGASTAFKEPWDRLRILTDGESVFVIDGNRGINAIGGQVVSLILLGDLEKTAKQLCGRETVATQPGKGGIVVAPALQFERRPRRRRN